MVGYIFAVSSFSRKNNAAHTHLHVHTNIHTNHAHAQFLQKLRVNL